MDCASFKLFSLLMDSKLFFLRMIIDVTISYDMTISKDLFHFFSIYIFFFANDCSMLM